MDLSLKKFTINITSREQPDEKGVFLKRLGTLLEEGYSIKDALAFLLKIEKNATKEWIKMIQKGMLMGNDLNEELDNLAFPTKTCAQIYFACNYGDYGQTIIRSGVQLLYEMDKMNKLSSLLF